MTDQYKKWLEWTRTDSRNKVKPLTKTQWEFVELLLQENNAKHLVKVGDLESFFKSVRKFLRS